MSYEIRFLPAENGDCILFQTINTTIVIDGGYARTFNKFLKPLIKNTEKIDLIILTHIDDDHILGLIELVKQHAELPKITTIIANTFNQINQMLSIENDTDKPIVFTDSFDYLSCKNAKSFDSEIESIQVNLNGMYVNENLKFKINNCVFTFLSPNKDQLRQLYNYYEKWLEGLQSTPTTTYLTSPSNDYFKTIDELVGNDFIEDISITNNSSLAFLVEIKNSKFLLLGDANIITVTENLRKLGYSKDNKLDLDFVKLSHHGSKKNISNEFLEIIKTNKFIISTNGMRHSHPDKETLAKIIMNPERDLSQCVDLMFNYPSETYKSIFTLNELDNSELNFRLIFGNPKDGLLIKK